MFVVVCDIHRVVHSLSVDTKLDNIITLLTALAYDYTCMGIFEKHKDMFAFQLALRCVVLFFDTLCSCFFL